MNNPPYPQPSTKHAVVLGSVDRIIGEPANCRVPMVDTLYTTPQRGARFTPTQFYARWRATPFPTRIQVIRVSSSGGGPDVLLNVDTMGTGPTIPGDIFLWASNSLATYLLRLLTVQIPAGAPWAVNTILNLGGNPGRMGILHSDAVNTYTFHFDHPDLAAGYFGMARGGTLVVPPGVAAPGVVTPYLLDLQPLRDLRLRWNHLDPTVAGTVPTHMGMKDAIVIGGAIDTPSNTPTNVGTLQYAWRREVPYYLKGGGQNRQDSEFQLVGRFSDNPNWYQVDALGDWVLEGVLELESPLGMPPPQTPHTIYGANQMPLQPLASVEYTGGVQAGYAYDIHGPGG